MRTTKLYVGSIPSTVTEAEVARYFRTIDPYCTFVLVPSFKLSEKAKNYGFLTVSADSVSRILSISHFYGDHKLVCEEHLSENPVDDQDQNGLRLRRLFMRNLKKPLTESDLETFFAKFGKVESVAIVRSHLSGKSRSFGYVTFRSQEVALRVLQKGRFVIKGVTIFLHKYSKLANESSDAHNSDSHLDNTQSEGLSPKALLAASTDLPQNPNVLNFWPKRTIYPHADSKDMITDNFFDTVDDSQRSIKLKCFSPGISRAQSGCAEHATMVRTPTGRSTHADARQGARNLHKATAAIFPRVASNLEHSEYNLRFNVNLHYAPSGVLRLSNMAF